MGFSISNIASTVFSDNLIVENNENKTCLVIQDSLPLETIFFGVLLPIFDIFAVAANLSSFFVYILHPRNLAAPSYIYLASLAFMHSLALLSQIGHLATINWFRHSFVFSMATVYLFWPLTSFSSNYSICLFSAVTIERFFYNPFITLWYIQFHQLQFLSIF